MFFWKTQDNPWLKARSARKNPPILITMLLCFVLFWGYMYAAYALRELVFKGISALLAALIERGAMENREYAIYDEFNTLAYSFTFILLVPLGIFYAKLVEGRSRSSFAFDKTHFLNRFFGGFLIGVAVLAAVLGFLAIFRIFRITGAGDLHWLSLLLGTLCILIMCFSEEYFFRGMLLSSFGARNHPLVAILAAAVLSSVCNYFYFNNVREINFLLIGNHILLGCLLGVLVYRSGSLITAVGARVGIVFFSQLVLGIPFSNYFYTHSLFASKYTTASVWFTGSIIPGVDTGFGMFVFLALALAIAVFLPARGVKTENAPVYFRHVPASAPAAADAPADAPDPHRTSAPAEASKPDTAKAPLSPAAIPVKAEKTASDEGKHVSAPVDDDEDNWDEEETRAPVAPNYRAPEDYLKK